MAPYNTFPTIQLEKLSKVSKHSSVSDTNKAFHNFCLVLVKSGLLNIFLEFMLIVPLSIIIKAFFKNEN